MSFNVSNPAAVSGADVHPWIAPTTRPERSGGPPMRMGEDDGTGSKAAFDREVVELIPSLLRLAIRLCGDEHAAEDVVQDALIRAARSWKTFRGDAKLSTWLSSIVVNAFRDRLARDQRERPTESLDRRDAEP